MKNFFTSNLKYLLMKKGITQTDLSASLGIKPQTVNRYLAGKIFPSIEILILISEIFGVSLDDLIRKDMSDPGFIPRPAELYEKVENIDKLTAAFEQFISELKELKTKQTTHETTKQ